MERRDALFIGICSIEFASCKQLLHRRDITDPGELHNILLVGLALQVAQLHVVGKLRGGCQ